MVDREAVLAEFDQARQDFEGSLQRAPDAALRYKPAGEDYALGGLVVHVTDVLRRYGVLVDALRVAGAAPMRAPESPTSAEDAALIREGFGGEARATVLRDMQAAHAAFVDAIRSTPTAALEQKIDVTYGQATQPHPTAPTDVIGWVLDHYREHTQQVGDLVTAWADASR
jgi:hypothetical protein